MLPQKIPASGEALHVSGLSIEAQDAMPVQRIPQKSVALTVTPWSQLLLPKQVTTQIAALQSMGPPPVQVLLLPRQVTSQRTLDWQLTPFGATPGQRPPALPPRRRRHRRPQSSTPDVGLASAILPLLMAVVIKAR